MSIVRHDTNTAQTRFTTRPHGATCPHLPRAPRRSLVLVGRGHGVPQHAGAPDVEASNVEERGKGVGMGSSTDYESSDEEWRSPFIDPRQESHA